MKTCKLLLITTAAAMILAAAAGTASARSISASHQAWRATFSPIRVSFPFGSIDCALTLEGSFHARTTAKVAGALVGYVTRATGGACASGSWRYLEQTLPWHVRYSRFHGTLPNMTTVIYDVTGYSFQFRESFVTCLFRSTESNPLSLWFSREGGGSVTGLAAVGTIPSEEACFGTNAELSGSSRNVANEAGGRITLTLI